MKVPDLVLLEDPAPRVRRVTLNRPAKRNALNGALRAQLLEATLSADQDPTVGVVVLQGAGPDFCAGCDLDPGPDTEKYVSQAVVPADSSVR